MELPESESTSWKVWIAVYVVVGFIIVVVNTLTLYTFIRTPSLKTRKHIRVSTLLLLISSMEPWEYRQPLTMSSNQRLILFKCRKRWTRFPRQLVVLLLLWLRWNECIQLFGLYVYNFSLIQICLILYILLLLTWADFQDPRRTYSERYWGIDTEFAKDPKCNQVYTANFYFFSFLLAFHQNAFDQIIK